MSRSSDMTRTHRYPAIFSREDERYGTLLGWYESEAEARAEVERFRNAKPVSLEDILGEDDV